MKSKKTALQIVFVVGVKSAGKTAYLKWIAQHAQNSGKQVAGFLSIAKFSNGIKHTYYFENLKNGEQRLFASHKPVPSFTDHYGSYYFNPKVFAIAKRISEDNLQSDIFIFDEYGPLEVRGDGLHSALCYLLQNYCGTLFIAVRPRTLFFLQDEIRRYL